MFGVILIVAGVIWFAAVGYQYVNVSEEAYNERELRKRFTPQWEILHGDEFSGKFTKQPGFRKFLLYLLVGPFVSIVITSAVFGILYVIGVFGDIFVIDAFEMGGLPAGIAAIIVLIYFILALIGLFTGK